MCGLVEGIITKNVSFPRQKCIRNKIQNNLNDLGKNSNLLFK